MVNMVYLVTVEISGKDMTKEDVREFIDENLDGIEMTEIKDNYVEIKWSVDAEEGGPHEIEEAMYYLLGDDEIGTYKYELLK